MPRKVNIVKKRKFRYYRWDDGKLRRKKPPVKEPVYQFFGI